MIRSLSACFRLFCALVLALGVAATARAQSNCIVAGFVPPDSNFNGGVLHVLGGPGGGHIVGLMLDQDRNGSVDVSLGLPFGAQDATNYFLSPGQEFVVAFPCPNLPGCSSVGGPLARPSETMAILRVPTSGTELVLVHTDCLGGGLLNGNGRWYEAGLCHPAAPGLPCGATMDYALGSTICNKIFIARTDNQGNNQLRFYDLNNTTPATDDGRATLELNQGVEDTTLVLDRGGNVMMAKSGIIPQGTRYDINIIDICPGSSNFGVRIAGGASPYVDWQTSFGLLTASVTLCTPGTLTVQPRVASTNVGPALVVNRCCTGAAPQMGRCCNQSTGGCSVTMLAGCNATTNVWTAGATCATACPAPAPRLDLISSGPANVTAGQLSTYTFVCRNNGFATANNVTVRVSVSTSFAQTETVSAGGVLSNGGGLVTWSLGSLAPGAQSGPLSITIRTTCLATIQVFALTATATATNAPTAQAQPPVSVTTVLGPTDPLTASFTSVPASGEPLAPGTEITHTMVLTNPLNVTRWRTTFSTTSGFSATFQTAVNAGGGVFQLFPNSGNVSWVGDLPPNSTTTIVFTSKINDCLPPGSFSNQIGFGQGVFVLNICGSQLAFFPPGQIFTVQQAPITAGLAVNRVSGLSGPASGLPGGPISALVRRGATARYSFTLSNSGATAVNNAAMDLTFPEEFIIADPPFVTPMPGLTYDSGTRTLSFFGPVAPGGSLVVEFDAMLDPMVRCRGILSPSAGFGTCRYASGSLAVFAANEPPVVPHIVAVDYIDGLLTFTPGVDTELQPLICFNFAGGGSQAMSRSPAGDIYITSPFARVHPVTLDFAQFPVSPGDFISDVAFDPTTNTVVRVRGSVIDRFDPATGTATVIVSDPMRFFFGIVVGGDGRIATRSSSTLVILDPRPPAVLPLAPGSLIEVAMPTVTLADFSLCTPQNGSVRTLTVDGAGDYVVCSNCSAADGTVKSLVKVDHLTLATSVVVPAISGPPSTQPLTTNFIPETASAVGAQGEAYFGTLLGAALVQVDTGPTPTLQSLLTSGFPGIIDMAHTAPGPIGPGGTGGGCRTDFNNDGISSPDDLDEFITTYFEMPPANAAADYNNDGIVSPDDLDEFITEYFAGCP